MNSLAKTIIHESKKESVKIIEGSRKQVGQVKKEMKKSVEVEELELIETLKKELRLMKRSIRLKVENHVRKEILQEKENMFEKVFLESMEKLNDLKKRDYQKSLRKLIEDGVEKIDKDCEVLCRKDDILTVKNLLRSLKTKHELKISKEFIDEPGIIIRTPDKKLFVDNTYLNRLNSEKDTLKEEISGILFR